METTLCTNRLGVMPHVLTILTAVMLSQPVLAAGPLRVHPENPRYFTDDTGRAIYLAGHQSFVDLQDNSFNKAFTWNKQRKLDWDEYLDFLSEHRFNYLRNWVIWSTGSGSLAPVNQAIATPMPYRRIAGQGKAQDGGDRFDLQQFDEEFFQRLRRRCEDLQRRGIYVSIMLFEVYGFLEGEAVGEPRQTLWDGNVFNRANNVNGIHTDDNGDGKGIEFFYTQDERVLNLQRAYVRKVIDTVNHLDNVFYEIANELHAPDWQYRMIELIKDYERGKPKQHLVLMSFGGRNRAGQWQPMPRDVLVSSPADCIAVAGSWDSGAYRRKDPPAHDGRKPAIVDMDHVAPGSNDLGFVWSAFTRGYHFNLYDKPFEDPDAEGAPWQRVRRNVRQTLVYAEQMNLAKATPRSDLASTGFCLAQPGERYVVYQPGDRPFEVWDLEADAVYHFEWYDTEHCRVRGTGTVTGMGAKHSFAPAGKEMVLFLMHQEETETSLAQNPDADGFERTASRSVEYAGSVMTITRNTTCSRRSATSITRPSHASSKRPAASSGFLTRSTGPSRRVLPRITAGCAGWEPPIDPVIRTGFLSSFSFPCVSLSASSAVSSSRSSFAHDFGPYLILF